MRGNKRLLRYLAKDISADIKSLKDELKENRQTLADLKSRGLEGKAYCVMVCENHAKGTDLREVPMGGCSDTDLAEAIRRAEAVFVVKHGKNGRSVREGDEGFYDALRGVHYGVSVELAGKSAYLPDWFWKKYTAAERKKRGRR